MLPVESVRGRNEGGARTPRALQAASSQLGFLFDVVLRAVAERPEVDGIGSNFSTDSLRMAPVHGMVVRAWLAAISESDIATPPNKVGNGSHEALRRRLGPPRRGAGRGARAFVDAHGGSSGLELAVSSRSRPTRHRCDAPGEWLGSILLRLPVASCCFLLLPVSPARG